MTVVFPEVEKIVKMLQPLKCRYWIAGGWALDMFLGRQTRAHKDLEITVARADQKHLLPLPGLAGIEYVEDHERKPWRGQKLELPVHELYAHLYGGAEIEILLNEFDGENWIYRRNQNIRLPLAKFDGRDFLPPEIVLLYKSKNPRPEDEQDFTAAQGHLSAAEQKWLGDAIALDYPDHPWLARLKKTGLTAATRGAF